MCLQIEVNARRWVLWNPLLKGSVCCKRIMVFWGTERGAIASYHRKWKEEWWEIKLADTHGLDWQGLGRWDFVLPNSYVKLSKRFYVIEVTLRLSFWKDHCSWNTDSICRVTREETAKIIKLKRWTKVLAKSFQKWK